MNDSTVSGEASVSSSGNHPLALKPPPQKKKRNLAGMPDPDSEVIALSPKTLLATNRFICEICSKGFQREQNLQLHRRGHNLPWKLRQKSTKEIRKRVYVCPEPLCIHHDPSRALGDLTGIKKHYFRKHGEKKWKCEKCAKKYAVQSDWKAHSKICGTREYKCDCGTPFSRRDSFITHRAFCDALAEESSKAPTGPPPASSDKVPSPPLEPPPPVISSLLPSHISENPSSSQIIEEQALPVPTTGFSTSCSAASTSSSSNNGNASSSIFASLFASSTVPGPTGYMDLIRSMAHTNHNPYTSTEPTSLCLSTTNHLHNQGSSILGPTGQENCIFAPPPPPISQPAAMSATALLQKAAQMGATATNVSFLSGLGIISSENASIHVPGLPVDGIGPANFKELMMGTSSSSVFGPKQTTLDFLGLGITTSGSGGGPSSGSLSAFINSIGNGLDLEFVGEDMGRSS
ncbi:zinc finger protein ENHYDROUS-like [Impatiens glandulifera]|uniref:zinc finger protein ENHYDROUS-like n=1 Tax=Impatiens glandulifera TaxID=253017 RepID=UPI001FB0C1F6|nr:zinc finger protein ENHYDROUS-like [Impatiens glandulifera]